MVKTTRVYLCCDTKDVYTTLWQLQNNTRTLKNKAIQLLWEWYNFSQDYAKSNNNYPEPKEVLGFSTSGFLYDRLKSESVLATGNLSGTLQLVEKQFKTSIKDYLSGRKSIICYKDNQPIDVTKRNIKLFYEDRKFYVDLVLMSKQSSQELNDGNNHIKFRLMIKDRSTRSIIERCYDGVYTISSSKVNYDRKKKMWYLNLSYGFSSQDTVELDKNKILGVYLTKDTPFMASLYGDADRLTANKNEIEHYRNAIESRRRSLLKQSVVCGEGRIGHGYKKRTEPIQKISHKVSNARDTLNHKYSRAIVDYAVRKGCATIRMEKLTGVAEKDTYLKNWSYFDLQSKLEYKAKEKGIAVVYAEDLRDLVVSRCSKCGHINDEIPSEQFVCTECGFKANIEYNASQNLATKNIEKSK